MTRLMKSLALAALMALPLTSFATNNDPPGRRNWFSELLCRSGCHTLWGSCTIGGQAGTIAIKDPFCEQSRTECLSNCSGSDGYFGALPLPGAEHLVTCAVHTPCAPLLPQKDVG